MDFYFDRVLQPGQAGVIRVHFATKDLEPGPVERSFELQTNDPKHRTLKVTVTATIKALPAYISRLGGTDIAHGEGAGSFVAWPGTRLSVTLEKGERLPISIRLRPAAPGTAADLSAAGTGFTLTRESHGDGYLLNLVLEPPAGSTPRAIPLLVSVPGEKEIKLEITVRAPAELFSVTPKGVDFGEVSLQQVRAGAIPVARLGVRKNVGTFHIKSLSTTLAFIKLESQTIVDGTNYLIRLQLDPAGLPGPGTYNGTLRIETGDAAQPVVEAPIKIVIKD